ncbi:hypothetical protein SAMN06295888_13317 [Desulfonatronum zhilinae]|nr:hypothetical protein SAMN06295888_13317 [Desulfonatronum zhilinae]
MNDGLTVVPARRKDGTIAEQANLNLLFSEISRRAMILPLQAMLSRSLSVLVTTMPNVRR